MTNEKAAGTAQEERKLEDQIRVAFGQVNVDADTSTQKTPVMNFSHGTTYVGLKLVSTYDQKKNVRREPVPKITTIFNGKFVEVPVSGKWWRSFADFADKMAQALEGVNIETTNINDDVDYAKSLMSKFRSTE